MSDGAFRQLRRLADWFSSGPQRSAPQIARILEHLGVTAVPFLGRQLRSADLERREAARDALGAIAARGAPARARVTAELLAITGSAAADEAKVVALGLLSELGEHADARFADPAAIRQRSAIALAAHLETPADVASAADMMAHELSEADIVQMVEAMAGAAPGAAHRLATELIQRLDVPGSARDRLALLVATLGSRGARDPGADHHAPRGVHTAVLVDAAARLVVIASCRIAGARRWRRWAVLINANGRIDDCLHEDDAGPDGDAAPLIAALCADGYHVATTEEPDHARDVVAAAAQRTAESTRALPSPYYLGRDLLALADAHLGQLGRRGQADPRSAALARAIELIATGDHAAAMPLLERCDPEHPDVAAALAAGLLAQRRPDAALIALDRALAAEPEWPLHHWNRAVALHQLGDPRGCYYALRRFVAMSSLPSGLAGDPEQPVRLASAERMIADLERTARLSGEPLHRRVRRRDRGVPRAPRPKKPHQAST